MECVVTSDNRHSRLFGFQPRPLEIVSDKALELITNDIASEYIKITDSMVKAGCFALDGYIDELANCEEVVKNIFTIMLQASTPIKINGKLFKYLPRQFHKTITVYHRKSTIIILIIRH